jgi:prolyl 4-hydroxylase
MNMVVKLSPELRGWILHNLSRGCAPTDLINNMVRENFAPHIAQGLIAAFVQARHSGAPPPEDAVTLEVPAPEYHYETSRLAVGNVIRTADRDIEVVMRLEQPRLAVLSNVLSATECEQLIELSRDRLSPSTVVDPTSGANSVAEHRNSYGMFFRLQETPFIAMLDQRIAEIMNSPVERGEGLQVLRYGPGTQSTPHFDFLIPSNPTNEASLARSGQRIASLVIYLNDVVAGGETVFPEVGLSVSPRKGHAVYFEYANSRQQVDYLSLHAGAPVLEGEKWAVTKWIRERRFISG